MFELYRLRFSAFFDDFADVRVIASKEQCGSLASRF